MRIQASSTVTWKLGVLTAVFLVIAATMIDGGLYYYRHVHFLRAVGVAWLTLGGLIIVLYLSYLIGLHFGKTIEIDDDKFRFQKGRQNITIPWNRIALFYSGKRGFFRTASISDGRSTIHFNDVEFGKYRQMVEVLEKMYERRHASPRISRIG